MKPETPITRLAYVANTRVPSEKAHFLQTVKMCEAFSQLGVDVTLFVPSRKNSHEMIHNINLQKDFHLNVPWSIRFPGSWDSPFLGQVSGSLRYRIQEMSFAASVFVNLLRKGGCYDACLCRDLQSTLLWAYANSNEPLPFFHEAHFFPNRLTSFQFRGLKRTSGILAISRALENSFLRAGFSRKKIFYSPDGVDLSMYSKILSRKSARKILGWPLSAKTIVYCGHLYPWKGVYTLAESSRYLKEDCRVVITGGTQKHQNELAEFVQENKFKQVTLTGYVKPSEVPKHLFAADVVVLPHSARDLQTRCHSSPLKMFEYMASGRPVVASNIPSVSEILTDQKEAVLVKPDNPKALANGIREVLDNSELSRTISGNAQVKVQNFSWINRARGMLEFFSANI
jgi:glycosyltransferase involved in cell wall biosynthesis